MNFMKKINNNIEESYCSFEVSKLLKKSGFNCPTHHHYELALKSKKHEEDGYGGPFGWKKGELNLQTQWNTNKSLKNYYDDINWYACSRPTHSVAIEWIDINFGIMIWTSPHPFSSSGGWSYNMRKYTEGVLGFDIIEDGSSVSLTKQEAIEEALLYTLKNLI